MLEHGDPGEEWAQDHEALRVLLRRAMAHGVRMAAQDDALAHGEGWQGHPRGLRALDPRARRSVVSRRVGWRLDLVIESSSVEVFELDPTRAKVRVSFTVPKVEAPRETREIAISRVIQGWDRRSDAERFDGVLAAVEWLLRHEASEKLTLGGVHIVDPHPTPSTAYPDVRMHHDPD